MQVNIPKVNGSTGALLYNYKYDQLNRLVAATAYAGFTNASNTWGTVTQLDAYKERISYDANGNIQSFVRNGDAARLAMDNMQYTYKPGTNQLDKVVDAAADETTNYEKYNDVKQGQTNGNYVYDAIGNLIIDKSEGLYNPANPTQPMIQWNVYGKISQLTKIKNGQTTQVYYTYDVNGNRISKIIYPTGVGASKTTLYVRDAAGNVLSVYEYQQDNVVQHKELYKYGSARLGVYNVPTNEPSQVVLMQGVVNDVGRITNYYAGHTQYELTNHLGNTLVTISDRRIAVQSTTNTTEIAYYEADVITSTDYYSFGSPMPSREFKLPLGAGVGGYRYGFNGKELDKDINNGAVAFEARIYDSRLGKFFTTDPKEPLFPYWSPYLFSGNSPIWTFDVQGNNPNWPTDPIAENMLLLDAMKISYQLMKRYKQEGKDLLAIVNTDEWRNDLLNKTKAYAIKNNLTYEDANEFTKIASGYLGGFEDMLTSNTYLEERFAIWEVVLNGDLNSPWKTNGVKVRIGVEWMKAARLYKETVILSLHAVSVVLGAATWTPILKPLNAPKATSTTQQNIVNANPKEPIVLETATIVASNGRGQILLNPSKANITQKRLEHIVERHWHSSGANGAGKFAEETTLTSLKEMIQVTTTKGVFRANTNGRGGTIAEYNFGKVIGTTSGGAPASSLRVVIGTNGNVITAFPF